MRRGQNPAKMISTAVQPQRVSVAVVTYIPFTGGYYAESLEVLRACLSSLRAHTALPFDLMVFDNASCPDVRSYLQREQTSGNIQYLVLSDRNVGKGGAWNFLFGAAPGEVVVYADSDIYFFPGWLEAQLEAVDSLPRLGMLTGLPLWSPDEFSTATVAWAEELPEAVLERGRFLPWEDYWRHSRSLGHDEASARAHFETIQDLRLTLGDRQYYVGAGHFQFTARKAVLQQVLPLPSNRPMGEVRSLDIAINAAGYLRLSTPGWWVQHMGNTVEGIPSSTRVERRSEPRRSEPRRSEPRRPEPRRSEPNVVSTSASERRSTTGATRVEPVETPRSTTGSAAPGIANWKPVRRFLIWLNNKTFQILYRGANPKAK